MSAAESVAPTELCTRIGQHEVHPAANIFPLLEGEAFAALCADIKEHGLRTPIVRAWVDTGYGNGTRKPVVLDGRNRLRACNKVGVAPHWCDHQGGDVFAFVVSQNLHRRHLNDGQRAMVAARIATLDHGCRPNTGDISGVATQGKAAALLNVNERLVRSAKRVLKHADADVIAAVERGEIAVGTVEARISVTEEQKKATRVASLPIGRRAAERDERDKKIARLLDAGLSTGEVASEVGTSTSAVYDAKLRLGQTRGARRMGNPLSGLTDYAVEFTDTWESALANPDRWERATPEQRRELLLKLRGLVVVTRRLITRLNKDAGNGEEETE